MRVISFKDARPRRQMRSISDLKSASEFGSWMMHSGMKSSMGRRAPAVFAFTRERAFPKQKFIKESKLENKTKTPLLAIQCGWNQTKIGLKLTRTTLNILRMKTSGSIGGAAKDFSCRSNSCTSPAMWKMLHTLFVCFFFARLDIWTSGYADADWAVQSAYGKVSGLAFNVRKCWDQQGCPPDQVVVSKPQVVTTFFLNKQIVWTRFWTSHFLQAWPDKWVCRLSSRSCRHTFHLRSTLSCSCVTSITSSEYVEIKKWMCVCVFGFCGVFSFADRINGCRRASMLAFAIRKWFRFQCAPSSLRAVSWNTKLKSTVCACWL